MIDKCEKDTESNTYTWKIPQNLASGVYIYLITNNQGQKAMGKIGVIK